MSAVLQESVNDEIPTELSVRIPVTTAVANQIKPAGALALAQEFTIDGPEMAQIAADQRKDWAGQIDHIKKMRLDFLNPAKLIVEAAAKWFNHPIEDREAGRELLGQKLLTWDTQEKARISAENAKREAESRRIRQEADAKAAAERARAEEVARAERVKAAAAEAERLRQVAEAERLRREGDAKAAAEADRKAKAAAADAAKATEKAAAATENGEARAQETALQAAAAATAAPMVEQVKASGMSVRSNWIARLQPGVTEEAALILIVKAAATETDLPLGLRALVPGDVLIVKPAATRPDLIALLKLDASALNKLAKALKNNMNVPGYVAVDEPVIAGSRK